MKFGYLALLASSFSSFVTLGAAQGTTDVAAILQQLQQELPACALTCTLAEVPKSACALTDFNCVCTNKPLNDALLVCLSAGCTVIEQLKTQRVVQTMCGAPVRDRSTEITAIIWAFFGAATVAVIMRVIGRLPMLGGEFSWDDYTIVACMLALIPCSIIAQLMVNNGLGRDIWMLEPHDISDTLFFFYIEEFLYTFLVVFTKISILLLYLRIFTSQSFKWQCTVLMVIIGLFGMACFISTGLYCQPISFIWEGWDRMHEGKCVNINAQTYSFAGINMTLDIVIFILPIPQLWSLQMNLKKKLAVASMFAVGIFVTACSVVRLGTALKWGKSMNPTYDYTNLAVWSLIEITMGVICACMPGIANLLRRIWPRMLGTTVKPTYGSSGLESGSKQYKNVSSPKKILSKTTVSVSYTGRSGNADSASARSDELELTPPTAYKQHENYTRYSEETGSEDRKYGYQG